MEQRILMYSMFQDSEGVNKLLNELYELNTGMGREDAAERAKQFIQQFQGKHIFAEQIGKGFSGIINEAAEFVRGLMK